MTSDDLEPGTSSEESTVQHWFNQGEEGTFLFSLVQPRLELGSQPSIPDPTSRSAGAPPQGAAPSGVESLIHDSRFLLLSSYTRHNHAANCHAILADHKRETAKPLISNGIRRIACF